MDDVSSISSELPSGIFGIEDLGPEQRWDRAGGPKEE
jgi:hypothetical protein